MGDYEKKLGDMLNTAIVGFNISLAKETGVMKALLDAHHPLTSMQIAENKKLKVRYVTEILASLATAELINISTDSDGQFVYSLDDEKKQVLQSQLWSCLSWTTKLFAPVYEKVAACVPADGPYGVLYNDALQVLLDDLHEYSEPYIIDLFFSSIPGLKERLENGIDVAEFGCGKAHLSSTLATMFPKSKFMASDYEPSLVVQNRTKYGHIPNIIFGQHDLCSLSETPEDQYDWIFCNDVIHDLPHPLDAMKGIHKLLKPGAVFTFMDCVSSGSPIQDKGNMLIAARYTLSTFCCIPESYQREDSVALGCCWSIKTAQDMATAAGFKVSAKTLENSHALFICTLD